MHTAENSCLQKHNAQLTHTELLQSHQTQPLTKELPETCQKFMSLIWFCFFKTIHN